MPRKRRLARLSEHKIPTINPEDRNAIEDHALVRHALVDFDELAALPSEIREQLVADLVKSICFARGGVRGGKRGVSDKASAKQIFLSDVGRALKRAGLPVKRHRGRYDGGGGESFFFRLARALADVSGMTLPKDLKLLAQRAMQHQYGATSSAMKATQAAELAARRAKLEVWRQRLEQLVLRLKAVAPKAWA